MLKEGSNSTTTSFRLQYLNGSTCYTGTTIGNALTANFNAVTNNYAALVYDGPNADGSKGVYRIRGVTGGVTTDTVFESNKISNNSTHKFVVEFKGKNAAVWLDDFLISSDVYAQLPAAAGKIGFEAWSISEAYVDDIELMY